MSAARFDTVITRVCMWCGAVVGEKPGGGKSGPSASLCEPCLTTHYPDICDQVRALREVDNAVR